ncbi:carbon-nitrogen hydrolase family protein [Pseudoteredinibacter isoporae]|uniref:carbon-nitrogen hydrolase family protein n=1 Tax=Pseudoteredinibacter isoporae TaxID=570281 RepID=UPI0031094570
MTIKKVAAIQMESRIGNLDYNLSHVRELALEAIEQGAEIIALPEFFTTSIALDDRVYAAVLPPENPALDLLMELAADHNVLIGGSYLEKRGAEVYNSYKLVGPEGLIGHHDKDQPTMIENAFYIGGDTTGIHQTRFGRVGTAVCWETIRSRTVARLANNIDFLMTGSHWWTSAQNWTALSSIGESVDAESRATLFDAPGKLSRYLKVANIHASHCGKLHGGFPLLPMQSLAIPMETTLIGEAQIIDRNGQIVARRRESEGAGIVSATLDLRPREEEPIIPDGFWISKPGLFINLSWWQQNWVGKRIYKQAKKEGKF